MKRYKFHLLLTFCLYISAQNVLAQNDYFATDSTLLSGVSIDNSGYEKGRRIIRVSSGYKILRFTAEDIKEYGLADGTRFVSKEIDLFGKKQMVFLELLLNGEIKLYQYSEGKNPRFFIEKQNSFFIELIEEDKQYKTQIKTIFSSNLQVSENVKVLKFKKKYLIKLLDNLNQDVNRPVPHTKIGLSTMVNKTSLLVPDEIYERYLDGLSFARNQSFGLGLYIDTPIEMSNLSFNVGINYQKNSFSSNSQQDSTETDIIVNISSIDIPIMLRYVIPRFRLMPFFNLGASFKHNIHNRNDIYIAERNENTVTIEKVENIQLTNKSIGGLSLGFGVQYQLNYRSYISSEIRYNRFFTTEDFFEIDQTQIIVSFWF